VREINYANCAVIQLVGHDSIVIVIDHEMVQQERLLATGNSDGPSG
jgi:hypothetical protein